MAQRVLVMGEILTGVANIVRNRNNVTTKWTPANLPAAITGMRGVRPTGNLNMTDAATTYNVTNYATVRVVDSKLVSANIKRGMTILGVSGKSSVVETSDATAAAGDVLKSKTGYKNGSKITGTAAATVSGTTLIFPEAWCR